eukprot:6112739-Ditylum_brightwellii.AAC.1
MVIGSLAITTFKVELINLHTAPVIKQVIIYKVLQWCKLPLNDVPQVPTDEMGQVLWQALEEKSELGWHHFIK